LKIFGENFEQLIPKARELERVLRDVPGCADLSTEQVLGQPVLRIVLNQDQIARYGVSAEAVLDLVKSLSGMEVGEVVEGQLRFPLVVRLPESFRENRRSLATIMVRGPLGEQIPLSRLADIREVEGPKMISRDWGKRRVTIQCNVRGRDVGSFVSDAQSRIANQVELPKDLYRVEWGGQFENMRRAQQRLMIVVPLAMLLIVALLFLSFRNLRDTIFVFTGVPFACVGGIVSLALRDMPLSITAAIGFITLSGVSVLNNMVLVSRLRSLVQEGLSGHEAIVQACMASLRTVMMTALIASVGFIPMATSQGSGAEVQRPLATVVIGGVISSTIMTLLILPVLYSFSRLRKAAPAEPAQVAVQTA
jgi:cobalt-zinc-cadmium resistance protein CzcA